MKSRYLAGDLTFDDIDNIAKTIAQFHSIAGRSSEIDRYGGLETVKFNTDENFQQTEDFIGRSISQEQFDKLKTWTADFYKEQASLFETRIQAGKVRDCHGDLHMEHVCLTEPIILIDCIEFNDRFRYSDTASDLAFLLMDLDFHGGQKFTERLYKSYINYSGENEDNLEQVIKYYKIYRAYVRGKVNSFQLGDLNIDEEKKDDACRTAQKYFELALSYID
jgi:aminoglycoside phosphotransferase family enzyme